MSKYIDPTENPTSIDFGLQHDPDGNVIVKDGANYGGLKIAYDSNPPSSTTVTATALSGSKTATGVSTTSIDGKSENKAWTHDSANNTFSYELPSSVIDSEGHVIGFTITWSDGTRHDPKIIINNGNPSP